ncbi:MAG TPA: DUF4282 domain-containing protein [Caulobacteraceae bacterium]|jgi:hypothetical protein
MSPRQVKRGGRLWEWLTLEQLMTRPIVHLVYWGGLAVILLLGFGAVGATVGVAIREPGIMKILLALPTAVIGLIVMGVLALLWRAFCEFFVVIFRIGDDLHALRRTLDQEQAGQTQPRTAAASGMRPPY